MTDLFDPAGLGDADLRDAHLRAALAAASGADPDLATARASWNRRVVRARRRRAAAASLGGTAVLVLGALGIATFGPSSADRIAGSSTAVISNGSTGSNGSNGAAAGADATTGAATDGTGGTDGVAPGSAAGPDAPDDTMPADAEVVRSIAVTGRHELGYTGVGGTIQVVADADGLELASFPALPGFTVESTRATESEIVVVFVSDTHRTKLRARLTEGRLVIDRSEEPRTPGGPDTTPGSTGNGAASTAPGQQNPPVGPPITPPGATVSTPVAGGNGGGNGNGTSPTPPVTPGNPVTPTQPPTANTGNAGGNGNGNGNGTTATTVAPAPAVTTTTAVPGNGNAGGNGNGNAGGNGNGNAGGNGKGNGG